MIYFKILVHEKYLAILFLVISVKFWKTWILISRVQNHPFVGILRFLSDMKVDKFTGFRCFYVDSQNCFYSFSYLGLIIYLSCWPKDGSLNQILNSYVFVHIAWLTDHCIKWGLNPSQKSNTQLYSQPPCPNFIVNPFFS